MTSLRAINSELAKSHPGVSVQAAHVDGYPVIKTSGEYYGLCSLTLGLDSLPQWLEEIGRMVARSGVSK